MTDCHHCHIFCYVTLSGFCTTGVAVRAATLELDNTTFSNFNSDVRFAVLTASFVRIPAFGDTALCCWISGSSCFGSWCFRNVGNHGPSNRASYENSCICRGVAEPSVVWNLRRHRSVMCLRPSGKTLD